MSSALYHAVITGRLSFHDETVSLRTSPESPTTTLLLIWWRFFIYQANRLLWNQSFPIWQQFLCPFHWAEVQQEICFWRLREDTNHKEHRSLSKIPTCELSFLSTEEYLIYSPHIRPKFHPSLSRFLQFAFSHKRNDLLIAWVEARDSLQMCELLRLCLSVLDVSFPSLHQLQ